jgi:ABC-2 type transport system permease protein
MRNKKFLTVAKFEFKQIVQKPSFWVTTLFLPILIGVISFISGYSSQDTVKQIEEMSQQFTKYIVVDDSNTFENEMIQSPFVQETDKEIAKAEVQKSEDVALFYFPENFLETNFYEIYYPKSDSLIAGANLQSVGSTFIKQTAIVKVTDPKTQQLLTISPSSKTYEYDPLEGFKSATITDYIMPIASLVLFFLFVFISSSFMLQSVSMEKENRMIETILSIVDKKSLMVGKLVGLTGVVIFQLLIWVVLGVAIYFGVMEVINLEIPIDFSSLDYSVLPLNIFLILTGFFFFSAIMMGVGSIGTGANDSKNLSSIFIMLSVFPLYLMQIFITNPSSILAKVLSYFPFTSYMVLLMRNSLDALPTTELIIGIILSIVYVVVAMYIAMRMFELGCLMYNRRPTFKELKSALRQR